MAGNFPGYDVLDKRNGPSWNEATRTVMDRRLAEPRERRFFTPEQWLTLTALCARILPQPADRPPVPLPAMIARKAEEVASEGFRDHRLPPLGTAWRRGLDAIEAEAQDRRGRPFHDLEPRAQDELLRQVQDGKAAHEAWDGMPPGLFFSQRVLHDVTAAYYSHPVSWNEIGFGGPASPRGYVRMNAGRRDPWEAAAADALGPERAERENVRIR